MRNGEHFQVPRAQAPSFAISQACREDISRSIQLHGEVFIVMQDGQTGKIQEEQHLKNVVTLDASILLARLMKNSAEPPHGIYALAIGTGDINWNVLAPPVATNTQRSLYSELCRKTFTSTQFVNSVGAPVAYPTPVIDLTCQYAESEAVGPLCEMGLLGGNVSSNMSIRNPALPSNGARDTTLDLTTRDTLCNYLSFPVIVKPATSTLSITWRLSF